MNEFQQSPPFNRYLPRQPNNSSSTSPIKSNLNYNSLNEMRGLINEIIPYVEGRKQILKYFDGSYSQTWLIRELMSSLQILVSRKSGIQFLSSILKKLIVPIPDFQNEVLNLIVPLLGKSDTSDPIRDAICKLLVDLISTQLLPNDKMRDLAQTIFDSSEINFSTEFTNLLISLLQYYIIDLDVILMFVSKNIHRNKQHIKAYCFLLRETNDAIYTRISSMYMNEYDTFANDECLVKIICTIIERGPNYNINAIFDKVINVNDSILIKGTQWQICNALCQEGTKQMAEKLLTKMESFLHEKDLFLPRHFDLLFNSMISSISLIGRVEFLKRNSESIEKIIGKMPMLQQHMIYIEELCNND